MASEKDRHTGRRIDTWYPEEEYDNILKAMQILHMKNRSELIRTAVRNFSTWIREKAAKDAK